MKKILLAVMAVAAIGFTSCGNKTQQGEAIDSTAIVDSLAGVAADDAISALTEQLEAGDASKLQAALEAAKAKIAELIKTNPEVAKEYVAKVQTFLKENADKVKSVIGDNAVAAAAVSALTEVEPETVVSGLLEKVEGAKDAAVDAANEAKDAAVDAANEKIDEAKAAAEQKAGEAVDDAAAAAKKKLGL